MAEIKDFPSNTISDRTKKPKPRPELKSLSKPNDSSPPKAVRKKKSFGKRIKDIMITVSFEEWLELMLQRSILPGVQWLLSDMAMKGISILFTGDSYGRSYSQGGSWNAGPSPSTSRYYSVSYDKPYNKPYVGKSQAGYSLDEVAFNSEFEANEVFGQLCDQIEEFGYTTVYKFYSFADVTPDWVDEGYGWNDLSGSDIVRTPEGRYALILPKPKPLALIKK